MRPNRDDTHGLSGSPRRATALACLGLLLVLSALAVAIVLSERQAKSRIVANFSLRGKSSATFVATFLDQQASREQYAARQFLAGVHVQPERFRIVVASFGSPAAVLLDRSGRLLDVVPSKPSLIGSPIATNYAHLAAAERRCRSGARSGGCPFLGR